MNLKKLGLHGESLGGMVASHIAANKNIDFIFVDRTFTSLYKVARHSYGIMLGTLYYILVRWYENYSKKFVAA